MLTTCRNIQNLVVAENASIRLGDGFIGFLVVAKLAHFTVSPGKDLVTVGGDGGEMIASWSDLGDWAEGGLRTGTLWARFGVVREAHLMGISASKTKRLHWLIRRYCDVHRHPNRQFCVPAKRHLNFFRDKSILEIAQSQLTVIIQADRKDGPVSSEQGKEWYEPQTIETIPPWARWRREWYESGGGLNVLWRSRTRRPSCPCSPSKRKLHRRQLRRNKWFAPAEIF